MYDIYLKSKYFFFFKTHKINTTTNLSVYILINMKHS